MNAQELVGQLRKLAAESERCLAIFVAAGDENNATLCRSEGEVARLAADRIERLEIEATKMSKVTLHEAVASFGRSLLAILNGAPQKEG